MRRLLVLSTLLCALAAPHASAQTYPTKTIRLVVPFAPGGAVDTVARAVSNRLSERLGHSVIIENKPGAGGLVGTAEVAHATPDGHTLLMVFDTHAVNHYIYPTITFDTFKDLAPISLVASSPMTLTASNELNVKTVDDLVAKARASAKGLSCGHVGPGSSNQLSMLKLEQRAGFRCTEITYRGAGPLVNDLIGGHLDIAFVALPVVMSQIAGKTVTGVAIGAKSEIVELPGVPTVAATYPDFFASSWVGFLAPAGTPPEIIKKLNAEMTATLAEPGVRERLAPLGFSIEASSPEDFAQFIRAESDRWGPMIKAAETAAK